MMVREPVQSCEAWVRDKYLEKDYFGLVSLIVTILLEIDNTIYSRKYSIGVRLEDLKSFPGRQFLRFVNG